jgi:hypothetical protein
VEQHGTARAAVVRVRLVAMQLLKPLLVMAATAQALALTAPQQLMLVVAAGAAIADQPAQVEAQVAQAAAVTAVRTLLVLTGPQTLAVAAAGHLMVNLVEPEAPVLLLFAILHEVKHVSFRTN